MKMEQSVPKRRHIKFRRRGITQKKAYSIQNKAKVWNRGKNSVWSISVRDKWKHGDGTELTSWVCQLKRVKQVERKRP